MKPTVDLTIDRTFQDEKKYTLPDFMKTRKKGLDGIFYILSHEKLPYESAFKLITSDDHFTKEWHPIHLGVAKQIRSKMEYEKVCSIEFCDRCGGRTLTPWRWDPCLCESCSNELSRSLHYKKVPWEND